MAPTLGILGTGHLAEYIVTGLRRANYGSDILISPRNAETAARLAADHGARVANDNQAVVDGAEMVLVCLPAAHGVEVLSELNFRAGQSVCSAMAGAGADKSADAVEPAQALVAMMPGPSNALGAGPCLIYPDNPDWRHLLSALGRVIGFAGQQQFDKAAAFGAFSGASFVFMNHVAEWFEKQGLPRDVARSLVAETIAGNAEVLKRAPQEWPQIMRGVATPGGITEDLVSHLEAKGAFDAWHEGLSAVLARLEED